MDLEKNVSASEAVVIRQVTADDLPRLEWEGEYTHFRRLYADAYRLYIAGRSVLWLAELDGYLIGQVFIHLKSERREIADGYRRAYLYGFRVREAYRNQGIGTRMMQVVEADLQERGFREVVLNVARDNLAARRLYERLGYRVIGSDPGRWSYLDEKGIRQYVHEPAWRMYKEMK
jgi:ribosomal protein S18 acetylase RimI-like enzyme